MHAYNNLPNMVCELCIFSAIMTPSCPSWIIKEIIFHCLSNPLSNFINKESLRQNSSIHIVYIAILINWVGVQKVNWVVSLWGINPKVQRRLRLTVGVLQYTVLLGFNFLKVYIWFQYFFVAFFIINSSDRWKLQTMTDIINKLVQALKNSMTTLKLTEFTYLHSS